MSVHVKPCPFCGGEAEETHYSEWGGPGNLAWLIRCTECHAKMAGTHHDMNRAAWNARAERTCENEVKPGRGVMPRLCCSNCGCYTTLNRPDYVTSIGETFMDWPLFCGNCGARVVSA